MITLAAMLAADRDALACDLWETYQVREMEALPLKTLAMLSCGLRENSRIKLKLSGLEHDIDTLMLTLCYDALTAIRYGMFGGEQPPKSVYKAIMGIPEAEGDIVSFETADEWEAERQRIIGGGVKVSN